jgi:hypothetical protein
MSSYNGVEVARAIHAIKIFVNLIVFRNILAMHRNVASAFAKQRLKHLTLKVKAIKLLYQLLTIDFIYRKHGQTINSPFEEN